MVELFNGFSPNMQAFAIWFPLAMISLYAAAVNVVAYRHEDWKMETGKSFISDLAAALMIGMPVLNWAVAYVSVLNRLAPLPEEK